MKVKYQAIVTIEAAIKAVEKNGDALQYVLSFDIFKSVCKALGVDF